MSFVNRQLLVLSRTRTQENSTSVMTYSKGATLVLLMALSVQNVDQDICPIRMAMLRNARPAQCGETPAKSAILQMDALHVRRDIGTLELVALRNHGDCNKFSTN